MDNNSFEVVIDFSSGDSPNTLFRSISDLFDALQQLDVTLAETLGLQIQNSISLERVKEGSLKTILKNILQDIPDDALRDGEFKKVVGHFLLKAKYAILKWCQDTPKLYSPEQVKKLQEEILDLAKRSEINHLPAYIEPNKIKLLSNISLLQKSTSRLLDSEDVYFYSNYGDVRISKGIEISDNIVNEVLTKEIKTQEVNALLKVKKPDYLGKSKWSFVYSGHAVDVSITDVEWLEDFQTNKEVVQPGDSIKGVLIISSYLGYEDEILKETYELSRVNEVVKQQGFQKNIF